MVQWCVRGTRSFGIFLFGGDFTFQIATIHQIYRNPPTTHYSLTRDLFPNNWRISQKNPSRLKTHSLKPTRPFTQNRVPTTPFKGKQATSGTSEDAPPLFRSMPAKGLLFVTDRVDLFSCLLFNWL